MVECVLLAVPDHPICFKAAGQGDIWIQKNIETVGEIWIYLILPEVLWDYKTLEIRH